MKIHHNTTKKAVTWKIDLKVEDNEIVAYSKADGARLASGLQGNKVLEDAITKMTGKPAKGNGEKPAAKTPKTDKPKTKAPAPKKKLAKQSPKEKACRDAGWTGKPGAFKNSEAETESDADSWDALYIELVEADEIEALSGGGFKQKYKDKYKPFHGRCGDELGEKVTEHVTDGDGKTDRDGLERFAKANDCWKPEYGTLLNKFGSWNAGSARASVVNRLRGKVRQAEKAGEEFKIKWV